MKDKIHLPYLFLAVVVYSITAWFSAGYYHADEQYQILEFAHARIHDIPSRELTWEYDAKIRSSIQPLIAEGMLRFFQSLGISNPYTQTFLLRLMTAWIALFVLYRMVRAMAQDLEPRMRKLFILLSYFLWFLPFVFVRFSSETYALIALMASLIWIFKGEFTTRTLMWIGFLLGLAFLFRFQSALASAGIAGWLLGVKRITFRQFGIICAAGVLVVGGGFLIDSWYYGEWVCTWCRYYHTNLVRGVASEFGESPWYMYAYYISRNCFWPVGIAIVLSLICFFWKQPRHMFTWLCIPFVLLHTLIAHKELRFLIPVVFVLPWMFTYCWSLLMQRASWRSGLHIIGWVLVVCNIALMAMMMVKPAGRGFMAVTGYISEQTDNQGALVVCLPESNPYDPWRGTVSHFYMENKVHYVQLENAEELTSQIWPDSLAYQYIAMRMKYTEDENIRQYLSEEGFVYCTQSIPSWYELPMKVYGAYPWKDVIVLYRRTRS